MTKQEAFDYLDRADKENDCDLFCHPKTKEALHIAMELLQNENRCECCEELTEFDETVTIDEIYGSETGFFHPRTDMVIHYCPVCGKLLKNERRKRCN